MVRALEVRYIRKVGNGAICSFDWVVMSSTTSFDRSSKASIKIALSLVVLVLVALAMAIPTLKMGVWLDECGSVYCAWQPDLPTLITTMYGRMNDLHPPLYYIFL